MSADDQKEERVTSWAGFDVEEFGDKVSAEDKSAIDPIHELNKRDLMTYVTRSLTHKERFIIEQYYQVGHTMREIGEMLALTDAVVVSMTSTRSELTQAT